MVLCKKEFSEYVDKGCPANPWAARCRT